MIVNLKCGTTHMNSPSEAGYMYAELRDGSGGLQEAGMFTSIGVGQDINPYLSQTTSHRIQNGNFRFSCDKYLALMAGLAPNPAGGQPYLYVSVGEITNYNPQNAFLTSETVTVARPSWLFDLSYGDFNHPGQDLAGSPTPCTTCSITKVTSIGQNPPLSDVSTMSYFGLTDNGNGDNAVHYYEVTFGNWQNGCSQYLCSLAYTTDASKWYVGPDYYPDDIAASSLFNPTGAVYESQDGIIADFSSPDESKVRRPADAFVVPPPPQCAPDAYGYCVAYTSGGGPTIQRCFDDFGDQMEEQLGGYTYLVQTPTRVLKQYSDTWVDDGNGYCSSYEQWSPSNPASDFGDPNLP